MTQVENEREAGMKSTTFSRLNYFALSLSILLFSLSIESFNLGSLTQERGVFADVSVLFWIGLSIAVCSIVKAGNSRSLAFGCVVLLMYSTASVCIMEPFGRMHDSAMNSADSVKFLDGDHSVSYADSFPGSFLVFGALAEISNLSFWALPRLFPLVAMTIYVPVFFTFLKRFWMRIGQQWNHSSSSFAALFTICLSSAFMMRNNVAPQTIGFLLFLMSFTMLLLPRSPRTLVVFMTVSVSMIVSHPLTPILALPIYLATALGMARTRIHAQEIWREVGLVMLMFVAWIVFVAKGVLSSAGTLLFELERAEAVVPSLTSYPPKATSYVTVNWIFYAILAVVLFASLTSLLKTRARIFLLSWLTSFVVLFAMAIGFRFFDRILLFGVPVAAMLFLRLPAIWNSRRLNPLNTAVCQSRKRRSVVATRSLAAFMVVLVVICVYRSYYFDNAVDRITESEIEAQLFLTEVPPGFNIFLGGFVLPFDFSASITGSYRGQFTDEELSDSDYVLISEQIVAAVVMAEGEEAESTTSWTLVEARIWQSSRVYDNGYAQIWL